MKWQQLNTLYLNWVTNTKLKKYFNQNLNYKNYSLWWSTRVVGKDNMFDNNWYLDLFKIFNKQNIKRKFKLIFWLIFLLKIIKSFFKNLALIIYAKIFFNDEKDISKCENCFHSYYYNFVNKRRKKYDRLYENVPYHRNKKKNFYIISLHKIRLASFKNVNLKYVILEKHLTIIQLFAIYIKTTFNLLKLVFYLSSQKKLFFMNGQNCENIIKPLLLDSFSGFIQDSLINAQGISNILKKNKSLKNFITYGEFTPGYRPVYFFVKKNNLKIKITSIQHGNFNENILYCLNHKIEFSKDYRKQGKLYTPMPDQMFLKGIQAKNILKKYYTGKIKIIGSISDKDIYINKRYKKNIFSRKKNILVCPSIGDHMLIERFFLNSDNCKNLNNTYVISPHPMYKKKVLDSFKKKFKDKLDIQVKEKFSSLELVKRSDLVICSFSSVAFKAKLLGKKSIRLVDKNLPILHSSKDKVLQIKDIKSFDNALNFKFLNNDDMKNINSLYKFFYYKNDKKAYIRFWKNL